MKGNFNKKKRQGPRKNGDGQAMHITHPPQLPSYGITRDVRLRFNLNAAFTGVITYQNLLDTILFATGTTAGFDLFTAVRVNAVEIWAAAILGSATTAILSFSGQTAGSIGDDKVHTDTSMGVQPAHIKARPDPRTQAGQFQASTSANALTLSLPSGAVIDVSMTLRQPMDGDVKACQNALVAATVGALYLRGLDGLAIATTKFTPVGSFATI
jgi:hypothetical protein